MRFEIGVRKMATLRHNVREAKTEFCKERERRKRDTNEERINAINNYRKRKIPSSLSKERERKR